MFETDLLAGKRILITGGGTGLGLAIGRRYLELGAALAICGRREPVLADAAAQLTRETGGKVSVHPCDIRDPAAIDAMLEAIWQDSMGWSTMRQETSSPAPRSCRRGRSMPC